MATERRNETATIRVLILDDGLVQREGIARVVEDTKAMTVAGMAATPAEALAILQEQPVALALVDLMRGDRRSGLEVGREMRRFLKELLLQRHVYEGVHRYLLCAFNAKRQPPDVVTHSDDCRLTSHPWSPSSRRERGVPPGTRGIATCVYRVIILYLTTVVNTPAPRAS